jgi:serine-type D-Ala-D-Ala carboxypeptidase (penicillin-binding protein 5/6)
MLRRPVRGGLTVLACLTLLLSLSGEVRGQDGGGGAPPTPPEIDASSWALMDSESGYLLTAKNPDERRYVASITKVMVALVALDAGVDLDEEITVSENAASYAGFTYSNVGLYPYDEISVREALTASLVPSGTDAVYALSEHLGNGSAGDFVDRMNEKAREMGLENTNFENPAGMDDRRNFSSARDIARITDAALEYEFFRETVAKTEATITTQDREIQVLSTNELLNLYPDATGVKTGTTPNAGASLVASAEREGESYIAVLLDARDEFYRFAAAEELLEYGFDTYQEEVLVPEGEVYEEISVPFRRDESRALRAAEEVSGLVREGSNIERNVTVDGVPASAAAGERLGAVEVVVDGRTIGSSPLVAQRGYEEASFFQKTWYRVSGLWN